MKQLYLSKFSRPLIYIWTPVFTSTFLLRVYTSWKILSKYDYKLLTFTRYKIFSYVSFQCNFSIFMLLWTRIIIIAVVASFKFQYQYFIRFYFFQFYINSVFDCFILTLVFWKKEDPKLDRMQIMRSNAQRFSFI